jgi:hypothetical protein
MKVGTLEIIVVLVIAGLILWALMTHRKDGYRFLPSAYGPATGGSYAEYNDECLAYPGNQFCMMTDGTPGVCVLNGMCVPDMEIDLREYRADIKLPSCTKPVFKEGCGRLCRCKELKGDVDPKDHMECVNECKSWYSPIPTSFPI